MSIPALTRSRSTKYYEEIPKKPVQVLDIDASDDTISMSNAKKLFDSFLSGDRGIGFDHLPSYHSAPAIRDYGSPGFFLLIAHR
jgi:hypothetical protein